MAKQQSKNTIVPFIMSIVGVVLLIVSFAFSLYKIPPFTTIASYWLIPVIPVVLAIVAIILSIGNNRLPKTTIAFSVVGLVLSGLVSLFVLAGTILFSAG